MTRIFYFIFYVNFYSQQGALVTVERRPSNILAKQSAKEQGKIPNLFLENKFASANYGLGFDKSEDDEKAKAKYCLFWQVPDLHKFVLLKDWST